jgi:hypothetical protein
MKNRLAIQFPLFVVLILISSSCESSPESYPASKETLGYQYGYFEDPIANSIMLEATLKPHIPFLQDKVFVVYGNVHFGYAYTGQEMIWYIRQINAKTSFSDAQFVGLVGDFQGWNFDSAFPFEPTPQGQYGVRIIEGDDLKQFMSRETALFKLNVDGEWTEPGSYGGPGNWELTKDD